MDKKNSLAAFVGAALGIGVARLADLALMGGLLATAGGAVTFAGYMTMHAGQTPHVNGMQYLAIFAQPVHRAPSDDTPDATASRSASLDMNPVGAIPRDPQAPPGDAKGEPGLYSLVGAKQTYAWLRAGNRIFAVQPGDDVPNLGHVAAIAQRDGRWTLIDDKGRALIVGAMAEIAPSAGGRFSKPMIFGDDR